MASAGLVLLLAMAFVAGASAQDSRPTAINATSSRSATPSPLPTTLPVTNTTTSSPSANASTPAPSVTKSSSQTTTAVSSSVTPKPSTGTPTSTTEDVQDADDDDYSDPEAGSDCLPDSCQNGGVCEETGDGTSLCRCFHGYTGPNCTDVSLRVDCGASEVTASLDDDFLSWHNITATTVVLARHSALDVAPSDACLARKSVSDGVGHLLMKQTHGREECGAQMVVNNTHVNIEYQVVIGNRSDVIERTYFVLDFSCVYPLEERVASDIPVASALLTFVIPERDGVLRVAMAIYKSANYSDADRYEVSPRLTAFNRIYVRVYLSMHAKDRDASARGDFNLLVNNCWCTPSDNESDSLNHKLINDGCPADQTAYFHSVNGNDSSVDFSVQMLKFIGIQHQLVYVHCSVRVCFSVNASQCQPGCQGGRVKRHTRRSDTFEGILSIGPMRIVDDELEVEVTQSTQGLSMPVLVPLLLVTAVAGALLALACFVASRRGLRRFHESEGSLGGRPPSYSAACDATSVFDRSVAASPVECGSLIKIVT